VFGGKFIINISIFLDFPAFFYYSKNHIKLLYYFIEKILLINLFNIFRSKVTKKMFFENSDLYELDPIKKQSRLFRKSYILKIFDPPYLNP
jgi:hypothetical protein